MSRKLTFTEMALGGYKFFSYLTRGGLLNINQEVTKRCNARCDFCDYWQEESPAELPDYAPVVRKLQPLSMSLTGGEPLLRKDLPDLVASLRQNFRFLVLGMVTNGLLLTPERGLKLWQAGLDELSISLDYLDERHDRDRGLPGLVKHIMEVVPPLKAAGLDLCFNVVVKKGNFRELPRILAAAANLGVKVSLSTYNCWRIDNDEHMLRPQDLPALREVLAEVKGLRRRLKNLTTGDFYLERIPEFFAHQGIPGCTAGLNWVQVTPDGLIKRCSDQPVACHFSDWHRDLFDPTDCTRCWYSCRGAAQEPWTFKRFVEMSKEALA